MSERVAGRTMSRRTKADRNELNELKAFGGLLISPNPFRRMPTANLMEFAGLSLIPALRLSKMSLGELIQKHTMQGRLSIELIAELEKRRQEEMREP